MKSKSRKIVTLSAALAALAPAAAVSLPVQASEPIHSMPNQGDGAQRIKLAVGTDMMSFVVGQGHTGTVIADHESHASHASHQSHASHASVY